MGRLFFFGQFFENYSSSPNFWATLFLGKSYAYILGWATFGAIFLKLIWSPCLLRFQDVRRRVEGRTCSTRASKGPAVSGERRRFRSVFVHRCLHRHKHLSGQFSSMHLSPYYVALCVHSSLPMYVQAYIYHVDVGSTGT
jgi:hypothetical protein